MSYGKLIQKALQERAELYYSVQVPVETIFDVERHHYLLL